MKIFYTSSIGKPWKGLKPNDRRKHGVKNGTRKNNKG
jgi:hypothetical protein